MCPTEYIVKLHFVLRAPCSLVTGDIVYDSQVMRRGSSAFLPISSVYSSLAQGMVSLWAVFHHLNLPFRGGQEISPLVMSLPPSSFVPIIRIPYSITAMATHPFTAPGGA